MWPNISCADALDAKARTVIDYAGREVRLTDRAVRIAALAPHIAENLFSLGLGHQIVATVDYADYPEAAKNIPRVGNFAKINEEALLATKPDLVITWASTFDYKKAARLEKFGLTVYVDAPNSLQDIARSLKDLNTLAGEFTQPSTIIANFEEDVKNLKAAQADKTVIDVFYQIWNDPLQTLNDKTAMGSAIELCGGRNVYGQLNAVAPIVSLESLLAINPDVIIGTGRDQSIPPSLAYWHQYPFLNAVKSGHIYWLDPDQSSRQTLRFLQATKDLCRHFDKVRELDTKSKTASS